ncbi:type IV pili methyl-accepting chemotaxis transducer N-terminal domain-containing protein [Candidatus Skiveiella danica]|uniref:type IV pili methyl-accepting chemotaxis transducer N-terminal domain-containing protein n=1 Tax=Candidatus Skiveiella danica TaxID=3386177 RepID=UPI0039B86FAD
MFRTASLSTKLIRIGASLLVVALASISLTLWVTWQLEGGAAAVNEAGRMRMQTWRLASAVQTSLSPASQDRWSASSTTASRCAPATPFRGRCSCLGRGDVDCSDFAEVDRIWTQRRAQWLVSVPMSATESVMASEEFVTAIDALVLAIEHQLSRLTAILNLFQFVMMALAIIGAVVMLFTGYMYVIIPLATCARACVEGGDFFDPDRGGGPGRIRPG